MTIAGEQTIGEVKDLLNNWDPRMTQLRTSYDSFQPQWSGTDSGTAMAFDTDLSALEDRWTAARTDAESAISSAVLPDAYSPAQSVYDELMKAIRQNYPPDGATIMKGDYDDLLQRLSSAQLAAGQTPPPVPTVQPVAVDADLEALKATQPLDVVAKLTGALAPTPSKPTTGAGWGFVGLLAGVGGAVVGSMAGPPGFLAGAVAGGAAGYALKNKIASLMPSWPSWL